MFDLDDLIWFVLMVVLVLFLLDGCQPYDSTDNKAEDERSGMGLYTDHMTGCQYLEAGYIGGITPRLDRDGNHICIDTEATR